MLDLPITFSGPMVRALLREIKQPGTGKTQTRRIIDGPRSGYLHRTYLSETGKLYAQFAPGDLEVGGLTTTRLKYAPGDRLYVREHWRADSCIDHKAPRDMPNQGGDWTSVRYEADGYGPGVLDSGRFRQAMHMPKWASRITLIVTEVRVERLQDCSEADAIAEGIAKNPAQQNGSWMIYPEGSSSAGFIQPVDSYRTLWDSIHGSKAWARNPWVVAYTFRPVLGNVSTLPEGGAV